MFATYNMLMSRHYHESPDDELYSYPEPHPDFSPEPPRWRRRLRRLFGFIVLIMALLVGYAVFNVASVSERPLAVAPLLGDDNGRTNVLLLGVGDPGHAGQKLSDTNMVVILDKNSKRVATVSLPRDLRVRIPGYGFQKLNTANALGGDELAAETVSQVLDIPIHYTVTTNFTGLKELVDAVGGVEVNVEKRLYDPEYPCDGNQYRSCGFELEPGVQVLDGSTALKYVRCRKGTCISDFERAERQQEVLAQLRKKLASSSVLANPLRVQAVTTALRQNLKTTMGPAELARFGQLMQEAQKNEPVSLVLSTSTEGLLVNARGSSDLVPAGGSFLRIQQRVANIFDTPATPAAIP